MINKIVLTLFLCLGLAVSAFAGADKFGYSGRLVQTNGLPVTGPVDIKFDLSYSGSAGVSQDSVTVNGVSLANGVFTVELDFTNFDSVLDGLPPGENLLITATDITDALNPVAYDAQSVLAAPMARIAGKVVDGSISADHLSVNCAQDEVISFDASGNFVCADNGLGSVVSVSAGAGIIIDNSDSTNPVVSANVDGTTLETNGSGQLRVKGATTGNILMTNASGLAVWGNLYCSSAGEYLRGIDAFGNIVCEPDDNTVLTAGDGIAINANAIEVNAVSGSGLVFTGSALDVDTSVLQARVINSCGAGEAIGFINQDGTVVCESAGKWAESGSDIYYDSGNVGIGTVTPEADLHIDKGASSASLDIEGNAAELYLRRNTYTSDVDGLKIGVSSSNNHFIKTLGSSSLNLGSNGADHLSIINNGNVGIGTTSPTGLLNVKGDLKSLLAGTVDIANGDPNIVGTGTSFTTELIVGESIKIDGNVYEIQSIADDSNLVLSSNITTATQSGLSAYKESGSNLFLVEDGAGNEVFKVTPSGIVSNVGITSSGSSNTGETVIESDTDSSGNETITFKTSGSTKATIDSSGNFKLGDDLGYGSSELAMAIGSGSAPAVLALGEDSNNNSNIKWDNANNLLSFGTKSGGTSYDDTLVIKDGKVGVGTNSPEGALEIEKLGAAGDKALVVTSNSQNSAIFEGRNNATSFLNTQGPYIVNNAVNNGRRSGLHFGLKGISNSSMISSQTTDNVNGYGSLQFGTRGGDGLLARMTITEDGTVGVGTTMPQASLNILSDNGANGSTSGLLIDYDNQASFGLKIRGDNAGGSSVDDADTQLFVNSSGVSVGTVNPAQTLHLKDGKGSIRLENTGSSDHTYDILSYLNPVTGSNDPGFAIYNVTDARAEFVINNAGNVGIGTATPSRKLQVGINGQSSIRLDGFQSGGDFGGLLTGSDFGSLIEGGTNGHIVMALRDNDINDGFRIVSGGGDFMSDSIYDRSLFTALANGNVGIGSKAPSSQLDVENLEAGGITSLEMSSNGNTSYLYSYATDNASSNFAGSLTLRTPAKAAVRVDATNGAAFELWAGGSSSTGYRPLKIFTETHPSLATMVLGHYDQTGAAAGRVGKIMGPSGAGTDEGGGSLLLSGGGSTGAGAGGSIRFQTADAGASGSSVNAFEERMRISSAGNIGIGETSPMQLLSISGLNSAESFPGSGEGSVESMLQLRSEDCAIDTGPTMLFSTHYTGSNPATGASINVKREAGCTSGTSFNNHYLSFNVSNYPNSLDEKMRITSTGNVGIGTSSPAAQLHIADTSGDEIVRFQKAGDDTYGSLISGTAGVAIDAVNTDAGYGLKFKINGSDKMIVGTSGNVGIGTNSPNAGLHLNSVSGLHLSTPGSSYGTRFSIVDGIEEDAPDGNTDDFLAKSPGGFLIQLDSNNNGMAGSTAKGFHIYDGSQNNLFMVQESNGKVGVGTANPDSKLQVTGGGLCVGSDSDCNTDNNAEGNIYATSTSITAADYAEYFYAEGDFLPGDLVGLNAENGLARPYRKGDTLLGIVSTQAGVIGNRKLAAEENTVLVALMGQVPVNDNQIVESNGEVRTSDGKLIGQRLHSGDIYVNISSKDEEQSRKIASLERENAKMKKENEQMKAVLCSLKPEAPFCKN